MALDINVPFEPGADIAKARQLLVTCKRVGYTGCCLNYATSVPLRPKDLCKLPRIELDGVSSAGSSTGSIFNDLLVDSSSRPSRKRKRTNDGSSEAASAGSSSESGAAESSRPGPWRTLHRVTVSIDSMSLPGASELISATPAAQASALAAGGGSNSSGAGASSSSSSASAGAAGTSTAAQVLSSYDVVAVAPGDVATLRAVIDAGCADVIVLDLAGGKLPFPITAADVRRITHAGLALEIEYAPAIRDPTARRFLISNLSTILRLMGGRAHKHAGSSSGNGSAGGAGSSSGAGAGQAEASRSVRLPQGAVGGLVLGSGARNVLELRSPTDVAAILSLAGMTRGDALACSSRAASALLLHAERRLGGAGTAPKSRQPANKQTADGRAATSGAMFVHVAGKGTNKPLLASSGARDLHASDTDA